MPELTILAPLLPCDRWLELKKKNNEQKLGSKPPTPADGGAQQQNSHSRSPLSSL